MIMAESTYSISDCVNEYTAFHASPDIVRAALSSAGKAAYTKSEAQKIIDAFAKKVVK